MNSKWDSMTKEELQLTDDELYCLAMMLHCQLRGYGLFDECRECKFTKECMPEGISSCDTMKFYTMREKLERLTGVNVGFWRHDDGLQIFDLQR